MGTRIRTGRRHLLLDMVRRLALRLRDMAEGTRLHRYQPCRDQPPAYFCTHTYIQSALHFINHLLQIVLSHFSMSTEDLGPNESFAHRQLRTTCDVVCPPSLAFIHGGLQLQITHHLFPRLPRHNLAKASALVKQFAKDEGLVYHEFGGFVDGNKHVVGVLRGVAEQVRLMAKVAEVEVKEAFEKKLAAAAQ